MRKSNAQRVREYRERKKVRLAVADAVKRTPWEQAVLDSAEVAPGTNAPCVADRPGRKPTSVVREAITREWVLDQLRAFALDPSRGTPAAVQALKVLLAEIPKGSAMKPEDDISVVRNTVRIQGPSKAAIDLMVEQRAAALGITLPPPLPKPAMIGEESGDRGQGYDAEGGGDLLGDEPADDAHTEDDHDNVV